MISLCIIVKADDKEAMLLNRCLKSVAKYVDEICITITGENAKCEEIANRYEAKISHFDWVNDFSKARNFNFSQATGDYIFWCDADDVIKGGEYLKETVEKMEKEKFDIGVMNYLYDFNEHGECTVKHLKTRIVKKGSVEWVGAVHEDFEQLRQLSSTMISDIEIFHLTDEERGVSSGKRNLEIARSEMEKNPKDPRSLWLLANALRGIGDMEKSAEAFKNFVLKSNSPEEKYIAYLNLADLEKRVKWAYRALGERPNYPNAYFKLAELLIDYNRQSAKEFIEIGLQLPKPEGMIVYNPRDYDYNPLMLLMRI